MSEMKCECGHVNPVGTILCESCGNALTEEAKNEKLHDMRYEGSARRSQTYNKTIIDKIWNFFSSVKVGVWLIVITLVASSLGTIFPQKDMLPTNLPPEQYYYNEYGWVGKLWYKLGFQDLYGSWWYLLLIAAIGVSLVICSLDRFIPLHRALKNQRVTRNEGFLKRQRLFIEAVETEEQSFSKVKERLKAKRYKVKEENGNLFAEKNRFSRWGPYVNHIGLIIFLLGAMLRFVPGMYVDELLWIREGESKVIPGTHEKYLLKNNKFILDTYQKGKDSEAFNDALDRVGNVAKNFQSNVTLYKREDGALPGETDKLVKVKDDQIKVNHPLEFDHYSVYQMDYKLNELKTMTLQLMNKKTGKTYGQVKIDLFNPKDVYNLQKGYKVKLVGYYPNFTGFAKDGEPQSDSPIPDNPAFLFKMFTPEHPKGEVSFVAIRQNVEPLGTNEYKMSFVGIETRNVSALTVHKDLTLWILAVGGAIFMFGVIQGAYWNHRRIWLEKINGRVLIAAHTNKNYYGMKRELNSILEGTSLPEPIDQQEKKTDKEIEIE
ncbi:cytochrome c biogenesis protein ResB [Bacillus sp. FJAT-49736]|uniref:cytochrome c biogenesis protein ResB n=1 Tax=Bacillus sp. FJAT-49736 TaxID=2833582 RepID=UPI001BC9D347|nr:cytochrome c biogenesis protein ResB [Bacillus sp. FJAT-49736]MBS4173321.1 cytochrome c biogenesis protein ResB [Bacillus sp. FJAT-49736]